MQTIVSRKVDPLESAVVSVCFMNAGTLGTYNVLPGEAVMGGTVRTFLPEVRDLVENTIKRMAEGIALAHGLKAEVTYERLISSVNNDERLTKEGVRIAQDLLGKDKIYPDFKPFMSSEDSLSIRKKFRVPSAESAFPMKTIPFLCTIRSLISMMKYLP